MKKFSYLVLFFFCLFFASCEKEQINIKDVSIVGKTFRNESLSLYFESNDSVFFETRNTLYTVKGKAKYEIENDEIIIKNPYGRRLEPDEVTDSYILSFTGELKKERIDNSIFFIVGPNEKEQISGVGVTLFMDR